MATEGIDGACVGHNHQVALRRYIQRAIEECLQRGYGVKVATIGKLANSSDLVVVLRRREALERLRVDRQCRHRRAQQEPQPRSKHFQGNPGYFFINQKGADLASAPIEPYLPATTGSSVFLSLPAMYGLHGLARTGPAVFHTTLN